MFDITMMAAWHDLQAAIFFGSIDEREPEVDHEGVLGIQIEVAKILVPRNDDLSWFGSFARTLY